MMELKIYFVLIHNFHENHTTHGKIALHQTHLILAIFSDMIENCMKSLVDNFSSARFDSYLKDSNMVLKLYEEIKLGLNCKNVTL